jgi:hypothetical protein
MTKPATNSIQEKENSPTDFPAPHTLDPRFPAFDNWKVPKMKSDLGDLSNLSKALPWFWTFEEAALGYHQKINTRTHIITHIYIYIGSFDETHGRGKTLATWPITNHLICSIISDAYVSPRMVMKPGFQSAPQTGGHTLCYKCANPCQLGWVSLERTLKSEAHIRAFPSHGGTPIFQIIWVIRFKLYGYITLY